MESTLDWVWFYLVTTVASVLLALYIYSKHTYGYFQKRGIVHENPTFPFGSLGPVFMFRQSYNETLRQIYNKHRGKKFVGFYQFLQKSVLIIDRELIKQVLVKNFDHFNAKNIHYDKDNEPLSAHLFALDGNEWKFLRVKMTPVFSSGKIKAMYNTLADCGKQLNEYLMKLSADGDIVECKDLLGRFGIAVISSTAFGVESDVFEDKSSAFNKVCQEIISTKLGSIVRNSVLFFGKNIAKGLKLRVIPRQTHDFIMKFVKDVVQYREENNKERNDFIQLMMNLKKGGPNVEFDQRITMDELSAQAYVFILAAYETISITMSFFLYEMAMNPQIQQRVLDEVDKPDFITYDTIKDMEYLEMATKETLRKHLSVGFLGRVCSKDYLVPGTDDVIEKGTNVIISSYGLHWDPELFPDPELFIPERFSEENKANIKPFSFIPFGEGPRLCIGMRFGKLAVKTGLAMMLRKFRVERTFKTPDPLKYEVRTITTTAEGGIWLRFVPRTH